MDRNKTIEKLKQLIHLDIDAVKAYDTAMENIDMDEIRDKLTEFRGDHRRHIQNLSSVMRSLGEVPPEEKPDVKGFFIAGFTAIRSASGTEGALKAMKSNETLTNKVYKEALDFEFSEDLKIMIRNHYSDEQRHLAYINEVLQTQPWETVPAV